MKQHAMAKKATSNRENRMDKCTNQEFVLSEASASAAGVMVWKYSLKDDKTTAPGSSLLLTRKRKCFKIITF
jgi:hypothetical protein